MDCLADLSDGLFARAKHTQDCIAFVHYSIDRLDNISTLSS